MLRKITLSLTGEGGVGWGRSGCGGTEQSDVSHSVMLLCLICLGELKENKRNILPRPQQGCSEL